MLLLVKSVPDMWSQPTSVIQMHKPPPPAPLRGAAGGPQVSQEETESSGKLFQSCLWRRANKSWSSGDDKFEYIRKLSDRKLREKEYKVQGTLEWDQKSMPRKLMNNDDIY